MARQRTLPALTPDLPIGKMGGTQTEEQKSCAGAIAVMGPARIPSMNVPTAAESGYPDPALGANNWFAFVAPPGTPNDILDFWNRELTKVLRDPAVMAELAKYDFDLQPGTRDELAHEIERDVEMWGKVVREAHITAH